MSIETKSEMDRMTQSQPVLLSHIVEQNFTNGTTHQIKRILFDADASDADLIAFSLKELGIKIDLETLGYTVFSSGEISVRLSTSEVFIGLGI